MQATLSTNVRAFLSMIAMSEIGPALMMKSDDGYNVIVGSNAKAPDLFHSYADHPRKLVSLLIKGKEVKSTAAGRYQILQRYFDAYKKQLGLSDFSPTSQDAIANQILRECRALSLIEAGRIEEAINACRSRWASLPGAGYNQNEQKMGFLVDAFKSHGGKLA